jgi:hypothetical protein
MRPPEAACSSTGWRKIARPAGCGAADFAAKSIAVFQIAGLVNWTEKVWNLNRSVLLKERLVHNDLAMIF